jgi:ADP-heptose:LPS heptosyltransferase
VADRPERERILVVRAGRGGDLVMVTSALTALLEAFPRAEVHLLAGADGRRLLGDFHPRLTRVVAYHRRFPARLWLERALRRDFVSQRYTRVYLFETKPFYRRWLAGVAPALFALESADPGRHFADHCLGLVARSLDVPIARPWVSLPVTEAGIASARALLASRGIDDATLVVGVHATYSGIGRPAWRTAMQARDGRRHRTWPPAHFARLAVLLREEAARRGVPLAVVLDVLPEERAHVAPIAAMSEGAVTMLSEPPDFQRYKGLLRRMDVLVSPNTGPMHMGAALGTPLVALFSRYEPSDCGPFMDPARYRVLRAEETATPTAGLAAIGPEAVAAAVWELVGRAPRR